ncbi:hypothetical protein LX36DRAFT_193132 [Colletotrichum falcatum]|nr:hypothetical protein LX36DRAFT_193132 [Colletotrichum falcatum]
MCRLYAVSRTWARKSVAASIVWGNLRSDLAEEERVSLSLSLSLSLPVCLSSSLPPLLSRPSQSGLSAVSKNKRLGRESSRSRPNQAGIKFKKKPTKKNILLVVQRTGGWGDTRELVSPTCDFVKVVAWPVEDVALVFPSGALFQIPNCRHSLRPVLTLGTVGPLSLSLSLSLPLSRSLSSSLTSLSPCSLTPLLTLTVYWLTVQPSVAPTSSFSRNRPALRLLLRFLPVPSAPCLARPAFVSSCLLGHDLWLT